MIPAGHSRPSPLAAALHLSTFVAPHACGRLDVRELGPLVEVTATSLPLAGAAAPGA